MMYDVDNISATNEENTMFTTQPVLTQYEVRLSRLPEAFDGFSIALISDLHGQVAQSLLEQLRACRPELIAVTGDLIDSGNPKTAAAFSFLDRKSVV